MILNSKVMKESKDLSALLRPSGGPKSLCQAQDCHETTLPQNTKFVWEKMSKREPFFSDALKVLMVPWLLLFS